MDLQIGDVVVLKSGSIPMTVAKVDGDTVSCLWFNEMEGTFPTMDFIKDTLDVIDEDDMDDLDDLELDEDDEEEEEEDDEL